MKSLLTYLFTTLFLFFVAGKASGQEEITFAKNYVGAFAGIEWNSISGLKGVEYERILWGTKKINFGLKGSYAFRYESGNLVLFGHSCCHSSSISTFTATTNFFTGQRTDYSGFFLHTGLGVGSKTYEYEGNPKYTRLFPAFEAGFGWNFRLSQALRLRWTNSVSFPSREAGITMTRISFGL